LRPRNQDQRRSATSPKGVPLKTSLKRCLALAFSAALSCAGGAALASSQNPVVAQAAAKIFHGKGKITGIDATAGLVSIDHEAIPGLMDAMEMQYEAKPAKMLEGLAIGDKVDFAVDGKTYALLEISRTASGR
jgi:Cu/Ag efflux protein CusF